MGICLHHSIPFALPFPMKIGPYRELKFMISRLSMVIPAATPELGGATSPKPTLEAKGQDAKVAVQHWDILLTESGGGGLAKLRLQSKSGYNRFLKL